jgi:hypothetical protein
LENRATAKTFHLHRPLLQSQNRNQKKVKEKKQQREDYQGLIS